MIPVIDLFAGPGGLNEGFSSYAPDGEPAFGVVASFEMEINAIQTLRLRSAVRRLTRSGVLPDTYLDFLNGHQDMAQLERDGDFSDALREASAEAYHEELGPERRDAVDRAIADKVGPDRPWVLIGGPPCQAYSLAGRSRRVHDATFLQDKKHFLFKEYLHILQQHQPTVFVMENVKGLLSSTHGDTQMFDLIRQDLACGGRYTIRSLIVADPDPSPKDFVIRAEEYGIPQRRHRVILVGVRDDATPSLTVLRPSEPVTLREALGDLPSVRSRLSPANSDSDRAWDLVRHEGRALAGLAANRSPSIPPAAATRYRRMPSAFATALRTEALTHVTHHEPRSHMASDLRRYEYLALMAQLDRGPLRVGDLPPDLRPAHKNLDRDAVPFVDRFKVQRLDRPSSTITAHLAKDGHYYIHPDPDQMRSLTVREAARLQTFPDDYFFMGPRTAQYRQVGNAVPPLLARQIAQAVAGVFHRA